MNALDADYDTFICGAIALLQMARDVAPCTGPEVCVGAAIDSCKNAMLYLDPPISGRNQE